MYNYIHKKGETYFAVLRVLNENERNQEYENRYVFVCFHIIIFRFNRLFSHICYFSIICCLFP